MARGQPPRESCWGGGKAASSLFCSLQPGLSQCQRPVGHLGGPSRPRSDRPGADGTGENVRGGVGAEVRGEADGGGGAKAEEAFREEALSKVGSERKAKGNQGAGHDECISARELFPRLGVVACATGRGRGCLGGRRQSLQGLRAGEGGGVWAVGRGVSQVGQLRPRGQSYAPASVVWRDTD